MHARELVELTAFVSAHGAALIECEPSIPTANIEQYWIASKVRLDRWAWRLRRFTHPTASRPSEPWPHMEALFEEVLLSEILTRTWTAVLCLCDRVHGGDNAEPIARSVLLGHTEARHRVLQILAQAPSSHLDSAARMNRLRRRVECWTDVLLSRFADQHDAHQFAFDPKRAKDFAEDFRQRDSRQVWRLLLRSLRAAFCRDLSDESPNADLNARIGASVLSCFPPDMFEATGLPASLWFLRLTHAADDVQSMLDGLLEAKPSVEKTSRPFGSLQRS
ncbi:MAG: hypothetical protein LLF97_09390 [Planctomycetaceae bacterium]|nr:hypothetical protein [Planctomycetaceae bacterium]